MITIEDLKKKQSNKVRLLGLDLGSKRIGISICDENQSVATPLKTLNKTTNDNLINELKALINENNIKAPIVNLSCQCVNILTPHQKKKITFLCNKFFFKQINVVFAFYLASI